MTENMQASGRQRREPLIVRCCLKARLYELEERLAKKNFIRISNSEIVNFSKIKNFDLSLAGTITIIFKDGSKTYVSRRYVKKIKQFLGI